MNLSNGGKSNKEQRNVNTRGVQLMNSEGTYQSALHLGYWNDMISIKMHPALDKKDQTETRRFDYDTSISTSLTLTKALYLAEMIETRLHPEIFNTAADAKQKDFVGVEIGGNSLFGFGFERREDQDPLVYAAIYKNLDADTRKPTSMLVYEFRGIRGVTDYNPESGEFSLEQEEGKCAELELTQRFLYEAVDTLMNATAHTGRNVDAYYRDSINKRLDEIGGKLGIERQSFGGNSGGGFNSRRSNVFGGSGNNGASQSSSQQSSAPDEDMAKYTTGDLSTLNNFH